jgi:uncharacterized membrane protein YoaK (UPF0700 family)
MASIEPEPIGDRADLDRTRGLVLAGLLSALAGMVDVIAFLHLGGLFVSFMSGNSTQFAAALGGGNWGQAGPILRLIVLFVLGAAAGQMLTGVAGRRHTSWVLVAVALLLAIAGVTVTRPEPMVLAMGALNAALHRSGNLAVSLTYVTGTLVKFGQGLGDALAGRAPGWDWVVQASPWAGLIAGGIVGAAVRARIGEAVAWLPCLMAAVLAAWSARLPAAD